MLMDYYGTQLNQCICKNTSSVRTCTPCLKKSKPKQATAGIDSPEHLPDQSANTKSCTQKSTTAHNMKQNLPTRPLQIPAFTSQQVCSHSKPSKKDSCHRPCKQPQLLHCFARSLACSANVQPFVTACHRKQSG